MLTSNSDYTGALGAGLESRLLRRPEEWSDGAERLKEERLEGIPIISGLDAVVEEVRQREAKAKAI